MDTIEIFKLFGSILVDSSKAEDSISKTSDKAETLGSKLGKGIQTAAKWGAAVGVGAAAAGGALMALANKTAESADFIDKLSERTGINREELQRWKYAAEQSGADIGKLEVGMKKLSDTMDKANTGSKLSEEAFTRLGVSMEDLQSKSPSEMFNIVASKLADMPDSAERNALGNQLLGKSYTELMPLLNAGSEGMGELMSRADELGLVMSEDAVKANVVFGDSMADVKESFGAIFMHISNEFLPILQAFLDWALSHMPEIKEVTAKVFETISVAVSTTYGWFKDNLLPVLTDLFGWVQDHMPQIKEVVGTVFGAIIEIGSQLWGIFSDNLLPILKALWDFISPTFPLIGAVVETAFGAVVKVVQTVVDIFDKVTSAIKTAIDWLTFWNDEDVEEKTPKTTNNPRRGHASGLPFVPYDGYKAELHRGETVLNANNTSDILNVVKSLAENAVTSGSGTQTINLTIELDGATLARKTYKYNQKENKIRGVSMVAGV